MTLEHRAARSPDRHLVERYRRASFPQRIGALLVDVLLFCSLVAVPAWLISWAFGPGGITSCEAQWAGGSIADDSCVFDPEALRFTRIVFYGLFAIWAIVYSRSITTGSSIGKRSTEIMVIDTTTGDTISYPRALARTVLSVLSVAFFGLGLLYALTNRDRRGAHDMVMGTRVISN